MRTPTDERMASTWRRRALPAFGFAAIFVALYLGTLRIAASTRWGDHSALQLITHVYQSPGGKYHSLRRFREARAKGPVDVVFLGSSHAYRGFDPRLFAAEGLTSMNLGSTAQAPGDSEYVARQYLPALAPRIVVVEVYYGTLASDGLESARDLLVNTPASLSMNELAWSTWDLGAIGFSTAKTLGFAGDESQATQAETPLETYVEGGYVESTSHRAATSDGPPLEVDIRDDQLLHLEHLTAFVRSTGAAVVWVSHPLPADHLARIPHRAPIRARIERAADAVGVSYWDYGDELGLDPLADFYDFHHLNASGVERFDRALLDRLRDARLIPLRAR